ncbi:DUF4189 domain-containing protein [Acinetobacter proteolyticus]|nr:DUF4189 domain-containing protein [Acinetobacter proteolyticus]
MNKYLKHSLCLGLLSFTGVAIANDNNPSSIGYNARHHAGSVYHTGPNNQTPPRPTGYWVKTWGAIAPSGLDAVLGTAVGADSKKEAERLALAECKAKGGENCKVQLAYHNQCGVMVIGAKELFTARAGSIEEATEVGIKYCKDSKDTNCRVYYSACTEPRFVKY